MFRATPGTKLRAEKRPRDTKVEGATRPDLRSLPRRGNILAGHNGINKIAEKKWPGGARGGGEGEATRPNMDDGRGPINFSPIGNHSFEGTLIKWRADVIAARRVHTCKERP